MIRKTWNLVQRIKPRLIFGLFFLACWGVASISIFYFQLYKGLIPCPLCEIQRIILMFMGLIFLLAFIHGPKRIGVRIYSAILFIFSVMGLTTAIRQIYLQSLPPGQAPVCGPGLNYLIQTLPLKQAIKKIFEGAGSCAVVQWRFLFLDIVEWSAVFFLCLCILNLWQTFRRLPFSSHK